MEERTLVVREGKQIARRRQNPGRRWALGRLSDTPSTRPGGRQCEQVRGQVVGACGHSPMIPSVISVKKQRDHGS